MDKINKQTLKPYQLDLVKHVRGGI